MSQHCLSSEMKEMAIPLMETPEQQEIMDLKEQLEQEKKDHQKTKSQLEISEIKRASEVEAFKNAIQCLVLNNQTFSKNNFDGENESKIQMLKSELEECKKQFDGYKLENDKKFDDLKEQISKGHKQEELQMLKDLNEKLGSESARLQNELSESTMEINELEEIIEKLGKSDAKKDKMIQELKKTIKQKECELYELKNELSDVKEELEKRDVENEELKKKYEEAAAKLNGMDEHQKAMKNLELKHSQLQQQHQQQKQQLDDLSQSKELKECIYFLKKYHDACDNQDTQWTTFVTQYATLYISLSEEDQEKCIEIGKKYREDLKKKKMNSQ